MEPSAPRHRDIATGLGLVAILLWSSLAALTAAVARIPPFELVALSFALSTLVGVGWAAATGERFGSLKSVPVTYWLLGVFGLYGYHAAYFYALQNAPAVEANLINYLWPLLIVVLSPLLPAAAGGRTLRWWHIAGALVGFGGTGILIFGQTWMAMSDPSPRGLGSGLPAGYLAALAAAYIWATYSVASRLYVGVPSLAVMVTSALTAIVAAATSLTFETWVWPVEAGQWLGIVVQGLGPVGIAFYFWDRAMKQGDILLVAVASYTTPLLSTALLFATTNSTPTPLTWIGALCVTAGAALGGGDLWLPRRRAA